MGTIHKHSTQSRNLDIMTNKNWTCIKMYKNIKRYQPSHTINSKNIFVKKREREKTVNTGEEYQAAYS